MKKLPLSLVVITYNEEKNIRRCIESVPFADDVVVVDSLSQDNTVDISKSLGARVFEKQWQGYGPQKAYATSLAKHSWVLCLDADEALSPELTNEIQEIFPTLVEDCGYKMPLLSFHMGRWIRHGGWYPDYKLRLFHKEVSQWDLSGLHERVAAKKDQKLANPILHLVFEDISDQVVTNDKYSTLGAQQLIKQGKSFHLYQILLRPFFKFIECYIWKRGFMDGLPGYVIAISASYSLFLKYAKLWEVENKSRRR